jgi:TRAP-type uncharacterized transport system substrate-binding protein
MIDHGQFVVPATTRSRLMLEVASELVGGKDWVQRQATISLRPQGRGNWQLTFFASDDPDVIDDVVSGKIQVAIMNPVDPLTLAYRGTGPFNKPLPLRIVTVIPSEDQIAFAVSERTGVTSLNEIRERRVPLRVSLRKQQGHSTHFYIKHILNAAGFSLDDIKSWGGEIRYDAAIPQASERLGAIERGEIDAVFDEAINRWIYKALDHGIRPLSLDGPLLARLEEMGFRRGVIPKADYPKVPADVVSLDFSGWAVFTRADAPDDFITAFCRALEARKDRIPWQGEGSLPLERMCRNTPDAPLVIPLHPAAERFWRDCGYLS